MATIATLLAEAVKTLSASIDGNESPKLDAQVLLAHVLDKSRTWLMTWPDKQVGEADQLAYSRAVERRCHGEPVAYITGVQEFWSLPISVKPCTLIPRPDTEMLVEIVLERFTAPELSVIDLGTGTGAIALALASEQTKWQITGVDFNPEAVVLAQFNAKNLELSQVTFFHSDWFASVNLAQRFNLIVSNPPYIEADDSHLTQGGVRFEPRTALVADEHGLADIKKIASDGRDFLLPGGAVIVEHGWQQALAVQDIFTASGYKNIETIKDYGGNDRITIAWYN